MVKTKNRKSVIHTGMLRVLEQTTEKGKTMGKPRMIGMFKPYTPNNKADRRNKPFKGAQKKGKGKK